MTTPPKPDHEKRPFRFKLEGPFLRVSTMLLITPISPNFKGLKCSVFGRFRALQSRKIYGTTQENLNALLEYLKVNYPQLSIVGCEPSLFRPLTIQEETELCDRINESKADFVWVALGAPRQEKFCAKLSKNTNAVWIAVGGAFNVISGVIPRAPQWMQDHSLEWLYRWSKEPKRLFKRYAETNSKFIFYLIKEKVEKR